MKKNLAKKETLLQLFREDLYQRIGLQKKFYKKKILDIGCGNGEDAQNFSRFAKSVVGVDIITSSRWKVKTEGKIKFLKAPAEKLPFKKGTFEAVFLKDVLHHVQDVPKSLQEIKRVSSQGATIIIVEGNRYNPLFYFYATKVNNHQHFSQKRFQSIIKDIFPKTKFLFFECYPPFFLTNTQIYKFMLLLQKSVSKISFLKSFFSYNVAIIKQ